MFVELLVFSSQWLDEFINFANTDLHIKFVMMFMIYHATKFHVRNSSNIVMKWKD